MPSSIPYHPFDPAVRRDPYPIYARLRQDEPVFRVPGLGLAVVSRYEDALEILKQPGLFSSSAMRDLINRGASRLEAGSQITGETLLGTDPPLHTRLRKIVNRGFTPRRITALEPRIRAVCEELARGLDDRAEWEFIADFAVPLPMRMIAEILGAEPERLADFKRWSGDLLLATAGVPTPDQQTSLRRTREELNAWVDPIIEARRARPTGDLISALVAAEGADDVMTAEEVGNLIIILLVAGNETTTNLLGNALVALLAHPAELDAAIADPSHVPGLVEEALRYDSPVQMTFRRATADTKLPGGEIGAGDVIGVLLGSANRDARAFRDPDRFDVRRNAGGHLAFGFGNHFCLGAPLARLEARVAFEVLLPRLARLRRLDADLEYSPSLLMRGPGRLRLGFESSSAR